MVVRFSDNYDFLLDLCVNSCYNVIKSITGGLADRKYSKRISITMQKNMVSGSVSVAVRGSGIEIEISNVLLDALAEVRGEAYLDIHAQIAVSGDIQTDSSEAEVIIIALEEYLGRRLPSPSDLRPEQLSSIRSLADMAMRSLD